MIEKMVLNYCEKVKFFFEKSTIVMLSIYLFYIAVVMLLLIQSVYGYPLPVGDKDWFYPVIFHFNKTADLSHPFQSPISHQDFRFLWHGFLFPNVQNIFNVFGDYYRIEFSSVSILIINCLILVTLLERKVRRLLLVPVALSIFIYQMGRPELIVSTVLLVDFYVRTVWKRCGWLYNSFVSATLFAISPLSSLFHFLFWVMVEKPGKSITNKFGLLYFVATPCLVYIFFFVCNPGFGFVDWILGLLSHSNIHQSLAQPNNLSQFSGYLWGERRIPYLILGFLYCLLFMIATVSGFVQIAVAFIFSFCVYWFGIKNAVNIYNVVPFVMLFLLHDGRSVATDSKWFSLQLTCKFIGIVVLVLLSVTCLKAIVIDTVQQAYLNLKYGNKPDALIASMSAVENYKTIEVPKAFYLLDNQHKKILQTRGYVNGAMYTGDVVFLTQFDVGVIIENNLPKINGYCLVDYRVHFLPMGVLYDWSFLKYEKCVPQP